MDSFQDLKAELVELHGEVQRERIARGVDQVAALWREEDGDLSAFVRGNFIADQDTLNATLERFEANLETIFGHLHEAARQLSAPAELDMGPMLPVDRLFAAYSPTVHVIEDLFQTKIAFVALLNFPLTTLQQKLAAGKSYDRRQWAETRLTDKFAHRVPAEITQQAVASHVDAGLYIDQYNIWMRHLLNAQDERLFPQGLRLLSHWNLRDELKADYADPTGLDKQRMIVKVMERIVTQTIPQAVIDNPCIDWNPFINAATQAPQKEIEANAPIKSGALNAEREPDTRYVKLLANFTAVRRLDPYFPTAPTALARALELWASMSEERVTALLTEVLASPVVERVAAEIEKRLGRSLEPHDLWYNGFIAQSKFPEPQLDAIVRQKYPTAQALEADLPRILATLGFAPEKAAYLAERIAVDAARGSGHALAPGHRGDRARLRTRVEREGMNYKGYNIAIHELGHNVEQVFSLYGVDRPLLAGVPNTAFSEAFAFLLQARDLELLGLSASDAESERMRVLNDFWNTREIAGVALVEVAIWRWLYAHPDATPGALREATLESAKEIWNRYYAPSLGGSDSALLAIYSHLISHPLYLFNYPLGHLISFQIEEQVRRTGQLGSEFERMTTYGNVTPDLWMQHATGEVVSAGPLLRATEASLAEL